MTAALHAVPDDEDGPRFRAVEVCARTGVTYRRRDFWARCGLLDDNAHGSGSQRTFTEHDAQLVEYVRDLLAIDIGLRRAFAIARDLADYGRLDIHSSEFNFTITARPKEHTP